MQVGGKKIDALVEPLRPTHARAGRKGKAGLKRESGGRGSAYLLLAAGRERKKSSASRKSWSWTQVS